ncbi:30S ribosomal protein S20 [Candidatus Daviesbacteria bacterium]|nr:30S ribosomal protein S20 [Candidatus Daviesbacteria bacterium]
MPIIRSAKKKMRQDKKKTAHNQKIKLNLKGIVKKMRSNPTQKTLQEVFSKLDKATKTKLVHSNKAARLKSRLAKSLQKLSK